MEDNENIRLLVCQRIGEVENAMKSLQSVRKTLLEKAFEAKKCILNAFVNERNSMNYKEMGLLQQVDKMLHNKDDVVVTQLSKLNQVLGCLRNCLESPHPCGDCLEKFEDIDMLSLQEVSLEFSTASEMLEVTVKGYKQFGVSPPESVTTEMEEGSMTKWLLTPTNNHQEPTGQRPKRNSQKLTCAEWLLQNHSSLSGGQEAKNLFTQVKGERKDEWLGEERSGESLPSCALPHFNSIKTDDDQEWLHMESRERKDSYAESESDSSVCTSSVSSSSCVIIPSSTSSEASSRAYVFLDGIGSNLQDNHSHAPSEVSEWVATCCSGNRSMSVFSAGSSSNHDEWLRRYDTMRETVTDKRGSDTWLLNGSSSSNTVCCDEMSVNSEWFTTPTHNQDNGLWLPLLQSKMESVKLQHQFEEFDHQKNSLDDVWLMKCSPIVESESSSKSNSRKQELDLWLCGTSCVEPDFIATYDWLSGEEKVDQPKQRGVAPPSSDREWLLVKNHMSKISASSDKSWLVDSDKVSVDKSSSFHDNKEFETASWVC